MILKRRLPRMIYLLSYIRPVVLVSRKGIMLTHANVVFNIKSILYFLPIEPGDKVVSFLPFSHVFERVMAYTYLAAGFSVYFSDARTSLTEDFKK